MQCALALLKRCRHPLLPEQKCCWPAPLGTLSAGTAVPAREVCALRGHCSCARAAGVHQRAASVRTTHVDASGCSCQPMHYRVGVHAPAPVLTQVSAAAFAEQRCLCTRSPLRRSLL
mmetsp:Transcript_29635/g.76594  ORF Transcript_29635/g.76594 Transcript_29635/m.76594 type:complete len:117 (-) Transcript_29635:421-771(-)